MDPMETMQIYMAKQDRYNRTLSYIKRDIDNGATETQIADKYFEMWIKHCKVFREYAKIKWYTNYRVEVA